MFPRVKSRTVHVSEISVSWTKLELRSLVAARGINGEEGFFSLSRAALATKNKKPFSSCDLLFPILEAQMARALPITSAVGGFELWNEIDESKQWQKGIYSALSASYGLISLIALVLHFSLIFTVFCSVSCEIHALFKPFLAQFFFFFLFLFWVEFIYLYWN